MSDPERYFAGGLIIGFLATNLVWYISMLVILGRGRR
jgi:hypothetical protein